MIINAITVRFLRFNSLLDHVFPIIPLLISRAEDKDWIIKYFILVSVIVSFCFLSVLTRKQNERVFISSMIQIINHEFSIIQIKLLINIIVVIEIFMNILLFSNCKFDFF